MKFELYLGECLEVMNKLIEQNIIVDAVITDPPYGKIRGKWDSVVPIEAMWERLMNLIKKCGSIVLFGNEPFSSLVRCGNIETYKYDIKWVKSKTTGFANANYRPMNKYEDIMVFSTGNASVGGRMSNMTYNPQNLERVNIKKKNRTNRHGLIHGDSSNIGSNNVLSLQTTYTQKYTNYPTNVYSGADKINKRVHPTQKPVALMEYLIKTYTNENETVLDFTMGSGSTGVACKNLNRKFIGIELDETYFNIAKNRIEGIDE